MLSQHDTDEHQRRATDESILAVQIFDQKKFKKKDQGFLGVVNVRIGSVLDLDVGGDGELYQQQGLINTCLHYIQRCSLGIFESRTTTLSLTANSFSTFQPTFERQLITLVRALPDHR